jgi:DNA repair protein RecN (Recombination protein N)
MSFVELKDIISELEDEAESIEVNPENLALLVELTTESIIFL